MTTPLPILEVTWRDASKTVGGWIERSAALNLQPMIVHSIGYLLDRSSTRWLLASACIEGGTTVGAIEQIPAQLILSAKCYANCEQFTSEEPQTPGDRSDTGPGLRAETVGDVPAVSSPLGGN